MKKALFLFIMIIFLAFTGCAKEESVDKEAILKEAVDELTLPSECTSDISLLTSLSYKEFNIALEWTSDNEAINNSGKVSQDYNDVTCKLKVKNEAEFAACVLRGDIPIFDGFIPGKSN